MVIIHKEKKDDAVSPVVGVMLMLVVTIIVAAVISMYASGLIGSAEKAPAMTMDVSIKNTGLHGTSVFEAKVLSVTEPIATKDLRLVTSWTTTNKTMLDARNMSGDVISGGATVIGSANTFGWDVGFNPSMGGPSSYNLTAPWGYGNGVQKVNSGKPNEYAQQFGNYTLLGGTTMMAWPAGQSGGFGNTAGSSGYGVTEPYAYSGWTYSSTQADGMQAVLGKDWQYLRTGDAVTVKLIHIPSGQTMYEKNVVVG